MAVGQLAESGEEAVRRDDVPALPEHRLDQERGHVLGKHERGEQLVELRHRPVQGRLARSVSARAAVGVRSGYGYGAK